MPDFIVCYTLGVPSAHFAMLLDSMRAVPVWSTETSFGWLVHLTEGTAQTLRDKFHLGLVKGVNFFVGEIVDGAAFVDGHFDPFKEFRQRFPINRVPSEEANSGA
jgi:hypothetical protein